MNKIYAGIGSRETPECVLELFKNIAKYLATQNFILRSGGAPGADSAFEIGCNLGNGKKEIFIPWKNFNGSRSELIINNKTSEYFEEAEYLANKFHPSFKTLKPAAKRLITRDTYQVLGLELDEPCDFVLCWTKGGKGEGGTGQAIRIAKAYHIPVFDVGAYKTIDEFRSDFWDWLRENYGLN